MEDRNSSHSVHQKEEQDNENEEVSHNNESCLKNEDEEIQINENKAKTKEKNLTDEDLIILFDWLKSLKLSKEINPRTITRDFSDGTLYAEILKHFFPKFVDLHNFTVTLNPKHKEVNWNTINNKILRKISLQFKSSAIKRIINLEKDFITKHLFNLKERIYLYLKNRENVDIDAFLCTTKSFIKINNTNFDDTMIQENMLNNVWRDKEEYYRKEILDRDNLILKYKMSLEGFEEKYRKLIERKYILNKEIEEIRGKIRETGRSKQDL